MNPKITLIAFKAEYALPEKQLIFTAFDRLQKSKADVIVANDVSRSDRGFEADTNEVYIVRPDKSVKKIPLSSKRAIAQVIVNNVLAHQPRNL